jgi:threonine/homoserine/homoserine lactone efflux protein
VLELLLFFFSTFAAGFLGTIPPGMVNLMAIRISVESGLRASLLFSLGYTVLEMIYGLLALVVLHLLTEHIKSIELGIQIASVPILIGYGIGMLRAKVNVSEAEEQPKSHGHFFRYGLKLGIMNPMALPYWITFGTLSISMFKDFSPLIVGVFLMALGIGAMLLLAIYAIGGVAITTFLKQRGELMNKMLGWFFIILALIQFSTLVYNRFL